MGPRDDKMLPPESLISWSSKRGLLFVKIHSATGRTHALEVENDAAVLAALRAAARAGTAVS